MQLQTCSADLFPALFVPVWWTGPAQSPQLTNTHVQTDGECTARNRSMDRRGVAAVWVSPRLASKLCLFEAVCCRQRIHMAWGISSLSFYLENGMNRSAFACLWRYNSSNLKSAPEILLTLIYTASLLDTTTTFLPYLRRINLQELLVNQYINSVVAERWNVNGTAPCYSNWTWADTFLSLEILINFLICLGTSVF